MRFTLTIDMDNAAFEDDAADEVARILAAARQNVRVYGLDGRKLYDLNGNAVGSYEVQP